MAFAVSKRPAVRGFTNEAWGYVFEEAAERRETTANDE